MSAARSSATGRGMPRALADAVRRRWRERGTPESIRITRVGLWFVLFTVIVGIAATNTGNNALYLVLAFMLALLVVSGLVSRWNLRRLAIEVAPPEEIYARRPTLFDFSVEHRGRLLPRWLVLVALAPQGPWRLIPHLPPRGRARGRVEKLFARRGRHRLETAHVSSLFPLGLFRKGMRYRLGREVVVYPEIFPSGEIETAPSGLSGDSSAPRLGWGHELHALRGFRPGDDPRGIHWKKSAQTRSLIFKERETEESERLSIVFDNGTGELAPAEEERFEALVSEAATAAWDHLERGFEVELVTREVRIPFGAGVRQRRQILHALALVEPAARAGGPLVAGDLGARQLRLALRAESGAAA
jgi:uncharacterized protein (DUF58 family)